MTLFARLETLKRVQGDIEGSAVIPNCGFCNRRTVILNLFQYLRLNILGKSVFCIIRDSEQEKIYVAMLLDF